MNPVSTKNPKPSHETEFVIDYPMDSWKGYPYYPVVPSFLVYYLNHFGIEVRKTAYVDTILNMKDRYIVEFYKNGVKMKHAYTLRRITIFLGEKNFLELDDERERIHVYDGGYVNEICEVTIQDSDGVFTLGLMYHGYKKQISITTADQGNIGIYINKNAETLHRIYARTRKSGNRNFILAGIKNPKTPKEYVEEIIALMVGRNDDEGLVEMIELFLRDPRLEKELAYRLSYLPTSDEITEPFELEKEEIQAEYKKKMADLEARKSAALALQTYLGDNNGLISSSKRNSIMKKKPKAESI